MSIIKTAAAPTKTTIIFKEIKSYIIIVLGLICYAFAWTGILAPAEVMGGGASGIGLLIYEFTGGAAGGGIPIGNSFFALNLVLFVIGILTIGPKFGVKTIFAIIVLSVLLRLGQAYIPADLMGLTDDKLLSSILGGVMCGIGVTVGFTQGGSTGGTDIIAMIINKYYRISLGRTIAFCDMIIVSIAYFIYKDISAVIYGFVTMGVVSYTIDFIMSGNKQTVQLMVFTKKYEEIAKEITSTSERGVTLLKSLGWYTKNESYVLMTFCRRTELSFMHSIIKRIDPDAFISNSSVSGIYGKGFEELKIKKMKEEKLKK